MSTEFHYNYLLSSTATVYQVLLQSVDPDFSQPIRIFYPRDGKSLLARLLLAPQRPSQNAYLFPFFSFFPFTQYLDKIAFYKIWFRDICQYLYVNSNPQKKSCQCQNYITWPSRGAAALAWRGALSSSPSLILLINQAFQPILL